MNVASYVRLYFDESGESHFEDMDLALEPVDFAPPAAPLNVGSFHAASETIWIGSPADWNGETPHPAPRRQVFCTVRGAYEVTASDGEKRSFPAGSVLLLEDTSGKGHSSRVTDPDGAVVFGVVLADQ